MMKFNKISGLCLGLLLAFGLSSAAYGQRTLTGVVQDERGEKLIGAVVMEKVSGSTGVTAADGSFSLTVSSGEVVLQASYVGFETRDVVVPASDARVVITLSVAEAMIDEIVVMGMGPTRRINVTGAVGTISGDDIVAIPVANISNALVGNSPGITGLQASGEPGHNSTQLRIRGVSTYGGNSNPLVVLDGIEQASERAFDQINNMDPNEIASVSILKDAASTAVYGIRGANGVIIVTTKRGLTGPPKINFSANFGLTQASQLQEGTTSYEYALMRNEAVYGEMRSFAGNEGMLARIYSEDDLWKFKNNRDFTPVEVDAMPGLSAEQKASLKKSPALYYQSHDLYKEQFSNVAPQWGANFNIRGGTEKVKYFASLGYFQQEGITSSVKYYNSNTRSNYQRYNYRANFDIDITHNFRLSISSAGQFGQSQGPGADNDPWDLAARYKTIMQYIYDANPFISPGIVDGHLVSSFNSPAGSPQQLLAMKTASTIGYQTPVLALIRAGQNSIFNSNLDNVVKAEHTMDYLLKGLKIKAQAGYQDNYNRRITFRPTYPEYSARRNPTDPNIIEFFGGAMGADGFESSGYDNWNKLYLDAAAEWMGYFDGHSIQAMVLGKASRYTMPGGDNFNVPSGMMGLSARVAYNYKDRYMVEFNAGYNGTEQFAPGKRFGFFPAISAGWVLSEEKFFPENDILTYLKLRASYGEVGNDRIGDRRFLFLPSTYNFGNSAYWLGVNDGQTPAPRFVSSSEGTIGNGGVTWERAKKYDIGLEFQMFRGRLSVELDWFKENRSDILTDLGGITGAMAGVTQMPPANVGKTTNQGYEFAASWSDNVGRFRYEIGGDVSYSKNEVIYRAEALKPYHWANQTGFPIDQRFGYVSDGFYNTLEELANRPYHAFAGDKITLGDIRYKDLNGDGTIDPTNDMAPIGYPNFPQFIYNVKLNLGWRGFDARILFTGTARGSYYLSSNYTQMYYKTAGNAWKWQYDGRWTPEKAASGAEITYPRAVVGDNANNYAMSDFWMASSDFFKLKNIEVGYTFKTKSVSARIFVSANNIATFGAKRLREIGIDPEGRDVNNSGAYNAYIYPLTKIYNLGVNLSF